MNKVVYNENKCYSHCAKTMLLLILFSGAFVLGWKYLNKLVLKFELEAGEDEKLFGSVTSQMISDEIEKAGYPIDKKIIILKEPIKTVHGSVSAPPGTGLGVEIDENRLKQHVK